MAVRRNDGRRAEVTDRSSAAGRAATTFGNHEDRDGRPGPLQGLVSSTPPRPLRTPPVWVRSPLMRHTLTKSLVPPAFALLTCIAGCDREAKNGQLPAAGPSAADSPVTEDERLSRLLLGSWESKDEESAVAETLFPDGTSTGTVTTALETGKPLVVSLRSTWRIEGKRIHERITESKPAVIPVGTTFADEIITLDGEKLVTRAEDGDLETRRRVTKQSGSDPADYPPLLHSGPNARSPAPEKH